LRALTLILAILIISFVKFRFNIEQVRRMDSLSRTVLSQQKVIDNFGDLNWKLENALINVNELSIKLEQFIYMRKKSNAPTR